MVKRAAVKRDGGNEEMVRRYFELVSQLRKGDEAAVDRLMELWHPEGVFEFAGAPPLVGTFNGALAIRTLYQNRLKARGVRLKALDGDGTDMRLGIVETKVLKTSAKGTSRIVAGWRTTVGTAENRGFDESGSHEFTFQRGKIRKVQVRVASKPKASELGSLSLADLTVRDIGRLSLAAWPVIA
jgi:ketosteroid isomerase-like protein